MQKALEYAIKSVTAKRQSEQELRERLQKRYPEADHDAIVERLKELEYLNDRDFSEAWIRHRSASSPRGKWTLRYELKRKGIQPEDMAEALESFDEGSVLTDLAANKWSKLREKGTLYERKQKLMRFLVSRGFGMSEVIETVNTLALEESD